MFARIGLAVFVLLAMSARALAVESRSDEFIARAIESHLFGVKAGELAQARAATENVRKVGAMLAKGHAQARENGAQTARSVGVRVPTAPSDTQRELLDALARLDGDRFEEQFISSMLDDYLRAIARHETQAQQGTDAVAKYAAETLPTLRDHLQALQGLRNERATR